MIGFAEWLRRGCPDPGATPAADMPAEKRPQRATWVMRRCRRCRRCDVGWAGDQPCWMCGRDGDVPVGASL